MSRYFRSPRTTQERRAVLASDVPVRRKRCSRDGLPSAWDDIPRRPQRTWKAHRRYRWRREGVA